MSSTNVANYYALVDCNNFFVSCERVFNPKLAGKPVVVLSNNDGCIIARSNEARALGIPMGAPHFQWFDFFERHKVLALSSNFSLYGDMSGRVMSVLAQSVCDLEIYSVDEAFLFLGNMADPIEFCKQLRQKILKWTGIPVSIGIAKTKTLAKVAAKKAKKGDTGVFGLFSDEERVDILKDLRAVDVWGIGRRMALSLEKKGIRTAFEYASQEDLWLSKHFSVMGLKVALELRGTVCYETDENPSPKKSILTSRTFGRPVFAKEELLQSVASFAASCGEKLREEGSKATLLQVFIMTASHSSDDAFYGNQAHITFPEATNYTPDLIEAAKKGALQIYRPGHAYKRAGVLVSGLTQETQQDLFAPKKTHQREKEKKTMALVDLANAKFGYSILQFAAEGKDPSYRKAQNRSPCYTTRWSDILTIKLTK